MSRSGLLSRAAGRVMRRNPRRPAFASPNPDLHNWLVDHIYAGEYDRDGFVARRGDVVVDVGANIGAWSVLSAQRGARVSAYEPHPQTFRYLQRNAGSRGVACHQAAVVGREPLSGTVKLFVHPDFDTRHSVLGHEQTSGAQLNDFVEVPAVTLDEVIGEGCDLLKLDCEGIEFELLDATTDDTVRRARRVIAELHGSRDQVDAFEMRLRSAGYQVALEALEHERLWLCFAQQSATSHPFDRVARRFRRSSGQSPPSGSGTA